MRSLAATLALLLLAGCGPGDEPPVWVTIAQYRAGLTLAAAGGCDTSIAAGRSAPLVEELNCVALNLLVNFSGPHVTLYSAVQPYLAPARPRGRASSGPASRASCTASTTARPPWSTPTCPASSRAPARSSAPREAGPTGASSSTPRPRAAILTVLKPGFTQRDLLAEGSGGQTVRAERVVSRPLGAATGGCAAAPGGLLLAFLSCLAGARRSRRRSCAGATTRAKSHAVPM